MSRLIDADHLKSILQEYVNREKSYVELGEFPTKLIASCMISGLEEAIAQIDSEPSAQPEQRWIPCKEKMPKELTRVLVCTDQGFVCIAYLKVNHKEKDRPWLIYGADPDIRGNVTKWMPLPET